VSNLVKKKKKKKGKKAMSENLNDGDKNAESALLLEDIEGK